MLAARFGDKREDLCAEQQLRDPFPERGIRMLDINAILPFLHGGGGIRCLTQPLPASCGQNADEQVRRGCLSGIR